MLRMLLLLPHSLDTIIFTNMMTFDILENKMLNFITALLDMLLVLVPMLTMLPDADDNDGHVYDAADNVWSVAL